MSEMTCSEQRSTFRQGLFGLSVRGSGDDELFDSEVVDMSLGGIQLKFAYADTWALKDKASEKKTGQQSEEKTFILTFKGTTGGVGEVELTGEPIWLNRKERGQCRVGIKWSGLSIPKRLMIKHWLKYYASN